MSPGSSAHPSPGVRLGLLTKSPLHTTREGERLFLVLLSSQSHLSGLEVQLGPQCVTILCFKFS